MKPNSVQFALTPDEEKLKDPSLGQSFKVAARKLAKKLKKGYDVTMSIVREGETNYYSVAWNKQKKPIQVSSQGSLFEIYR